MVAPAAAAIAGASGGEIAQITRLVNQLWDPKKQGAQFAALGGQLRIIQGLVKVGVQNSTAFWSVFEPIAQLLGFIVDMLVVAFLPILIPLIMKIADLAVKFADRIGDVGRLFDQNGKTIIGGIADALADFLIQLFIAMMPLIEKLVALFIRMLPDLIPVFAVLTVALAAAIVVGIIEGLFSMLWDFGAWLGNQIWESAMGIVGFIIHPLESIIDFTMNIVNFVQSILEMMGSIQKAFDAATGGGSNAIYDTLSGDLGGAAGRIFGKGDAWDWW